MKFLSPDAKTDAVSPAFDPKPSRLSGWRILIVLPGLEMGGAERQALLLARSLQRDEGAHVEIWGWGAAGSAAAQCDALGLPWRAFSLPPPGARLQQLAALAGFLQALRRARPDVLLPYTSIPNVWCGSLWRWTGARLCVWNQRDLGLTRPTPWLERRAVRQTPRFVANSPAGAEYLATTFGIPQERLTVIPNGVERTPPRLTRTAWRDRLGVSESAFLACMVANLTRHKDHETLIRAWKIAVNRLADRAIPVQLLLAGYFGDRAESLRSLVQELDLKTTVQFLGGVDDVSGLLDAVDLGVLSSRSEGSPNGVLECMAAGLPFAGTAIDGIQGAVGPGGSRFLAPPGDAEALADRLVAFASDPALRAEAGAANRLRVEREFSPQMLTDRTVSLLLESVQRP